MSRNMTTFALAGYIKRVSELPEERMLKARPRELRRICVVDNKHNPDFYVVGLVIGFLGLQFLSRWYPVLSKPDGIGSFLRGLEDAEINGFDFRDILGELWSVRKTDAPVFDAALYLKYGAGFAEIIEEIEFRGEMEFLRREKEKEEEMKVYGEIAAEWLGKWRFIGERKTENAQL